MLGERLAELGITLPPALPPVGSYVPARRTGSLLHLSGHISRRDGGVVSGVVGAGVSVEQARALARAIALDLLASATAALESIDAIIGVVRLTGYVRSAPGFTDQPAVINGASDLFVELLGEPGRHARSAIGVGELPSGAAVEIEAVLEVR